MIKIKEQILFNDKKEKKMNKAKQFVFIAILSVVSTVNILAAEDNNKSLIEIMEQQKTSTDDLKRAKKLILAGTDVNARDKNGETPLMWASEKGYKDIVEMLIAKGVDINATNSVGWTALIIADYNGHKDIVEFLRTKGAKEFNININAHR